MSTPKPSLSGTLATSQLSHVVAKILEKRLSGTLVIEDPNGTKSAALFRAGAPVKARLPKPAIYLGRVLVDMALIDESTHNRAVRQMSAEKRLLGQILIGDGVIDSAALVLALKEQVTRQLATLTDLPVDSVWGFYEGVDYLERWGGADAVPAEGLAVLWRVIRRQKPIDTLVAAVDKIGNFSLKLHGNAQIARFAFTSPEKEITDVLRAKPLTMATLLEMHLSDEPTVKRLVYALVLARHIDLGRPGEGPIGVPEDVRSTRRRDVPSTAQVRARARLRSTSSEAHDSTTAEPTPPPAGAELTRADLESEARRFAGADYYQILGVAATASTLDIQRAFFELAKRWHPDRLPTAHAELRDVVERAFARITEAHQTLSDEAQRRRYDELLENGEGSAEDQERVQAIIRAATAYQKAEVLLKKRSLSEAEQEAQRAMEDDPDQADYTALYAWIKFLRKDGETPPLELLRMLDEAVKRTENSERNRFYRGQVLKSLGEDRRAIADFRWVVQRNPRHVDALRELRIYEMRGSISPRHDSTTGRRRGSTTRPRSSGLFGKLFKR